MLTFMVLLNAIGLTTLAYFIVKRLEKIERKLLEHDLAIHKRMKDL
jgi:hypothetical protein